ncbi:Serpentine Receptor, class H [Caenorhabditis elegans]|uniref:Serpentine Receptor, class H n=1 Tax=Caenorhabditis elegans TaxID=6239 RepID=O45849_CAEEL|nr:Serpentine Receptor, class H [Caenorhabditis elegans]CAB04866.1 Serpentine Receptor, class H [Caenorhabditis elegans]|eukprot:NP_507404.1 Serpentine Receptor, class H [Caenorhabditis elegans]
MCIWRNSSYELDTFAPYLLHRFAIVEIPLHVLASYIVIFKTPSRMASVKWMMVFLHFCSAFLDLFIAIFSTQYYLVPIVGGYTRGVLSDIGISTDIQGHLFITTMCIVGMSILGFFESRYNTVVKGNRENILKAKGRLFYLGMHYLYALMFTLPLCYNQPDQMEGRKFVKRTLPCVPESIIDDPDFHIWLEEPMIYAIHYAITASVITLEVIYYFVHTALFLSSTKAKSQKTHKMQVQFFIALTIQIAVPLFIVIFPLSYLITAFITLHFDQMYNNLALNFIALHGLASSSVMLIVHKPYRDAVADLLRLRVIWAKCHRRSENSVGDASLMVVSSIVNIQRERKASNRI